jgi:Fe-S-cluster containining protein
MGDTIYTTLTDRIERAFEQFDSFYDWLNYAIYIPLQGILDAYRTDQTCSRGCSYCCGRLVVTTRIEALSMADYVFRVPGMYRGELRDAVASHAGMVKGFLNAIDKPQNEDDLWFARGIACPFLKDAACSVYEGRPLSCRIYHSVEDPLNCRRPIRGVGQVQALLDAEALFQMMIYKIAARLERGLATTGVLSIIMNEILESGAFEGGRGNRLVPFKTD